MWMLLPELRQFGEMCSYRVCPRKVGQFAGTCGVGKGSCEFRTQMISLTILTENGI
ncbi:hypothetical protein DPMN_131907 [Dreissena polymorpha]|uniref:Uncharacterized protein n=1 Tax=Dreissena polymorpha TaxID=45954 RepID=A0A9D4FSU1_DREPO|nr:hypothetical protein DPMN_131907 [Dreissena polymorpha]